MWYARFETSRYNASGVFWVLNWEQPLSLCGPKQVLIFVTQIILVLFWNVNYFFNISLSLNNQCTEICTTITLSETHISLEFQLQILWSFLSSLNFKTIIFLRTIISMEELEKCLNYSKYLNQSSYRHSFELVFNLRHYIVNKFLRIYK